MKGMEYKKTFAAKGSMLYEALTNGFPVAAKAIYDETTKRFDSLYPTGDRQWFENWGKAHE